MQRDDKRPEDLVEAPGGARPRELVHRVRPGDAVRIDETGSGAVVPQQPADVDRVDEMVLIPGGYRHRSLVHRIERGNVLDCAGGHHRQLDPSGRVVADYGVIATRPGTEPLMPAHVHVPPELPSAGASGPGWVTYASLLGLSQKWPSSYSMKATWNVPCAPESRSGQLIYLFPAFQNSSWIYQPVLQWGVSDAGGGDYWSVASWYVSGKEGHAYHSHPAVRVDVGDTLVGSIASASPPDDPSNYMGTCRFDGMDDTLLIINNMSLFTWASVTLEAYKITGCSDYPDAEKIRFWNISVETEPATTGLNWFSVDQVTDCGQHTLIDSNSTSDGEVQLWCRPSRRFAAGTEVGAASRSKDDLDIFAVDTDSHVVHAAWAPDDGWLGYWRIACGTLPSRAPVTAVSRSKDRLDIFAVDGNGHVVTAAWDPNNSWQGWWRVLTGAAASGAYVSCASRSKDKLDIFVVGVDGHVWTAAWEPDIPGWRGWWQIGDISVPAGSPVHVVSRSKDKLDIFVAGSDGHVWTAAWESDIAGWRGWWQIGDISVPPGAPVHAASQSKDKLDIFVAGNDFRVSTAYWTPDSGGWQGWSRIGDLAVAAGVLVHAVSAAEDRLDIFVTDAAGIIKTTFKRPDIHGWRGWSDIHDARAPARSPVTAVSRSQGEMDIFVVDEDSVRSASWEQSTGWGDWKWLLPDG
jgi:hypothetical protein